MSEGNKAAVLWIRRASSGKASLMPYKLRATTPEPLVYLSGRQRGKENTLA